MEREMKDVGMTWVALSKKAQDMCGGCLSVAYTLTGVRGNDDDDERRKCFLSLKILLNKKFQLVLCSVPNTKMSLILEDIIELKFQLVLCSVPNISVR